MEKCRFSIIVPVYNVETYLGSCVNSLMNQDYGNYEILLINDGSTDESGRICDYFSSICSKNQSISLQKQRSFCIYMTA